MSFASSWILFLVMDQNVMLSKLETSCNHANLRSGKQPNLCKPMPTGIVEHGWTCVMIDLSALPFCHLWYCLSSRLHIAYYVFGKGLISNQYLVRLWRLYIRGGQLRLHASAVQQMHNWYTWKFRLWRLSLARLSVFRILGGAGPPTPSICMVLREYIFIILSIHCRD